MNEGRITESWLEGFAKAAEDAGVTAPDQLGQLLKLCNTLAVKQQYPEEFEKGAEEAMGLSKEGVAPLLLGLGGLGLAGLLGYGAYSGLKNIGQWSRRHGLFGADPMQAYYAEMAPNMDKLLQYQQNMNRIREQLGQFSRQMGGSQQPQPQQVGGYGAGYFPLAPRMYPAPYGHTYFRPQY